MGLFTNRRKQENSQPIDLLANESLDDDWVDPAEALGLNGDLWDLAPPPPPSDPVAEPPPARGFAAADDFMATSLFDSPRRRRAGDPSEAQGAMVPPPPTDFPSLETQPPAAFSPMPDQPPANEPAIMPTMLPEPMPEVEPPPVEPPPPASAQLEEMGISLADQQPVVPPPPRRVRRSMLGSVEPAPPERRIVGNLEFDERGLLEMLGLPLDSDLRQVSAATTSFLADLDPESETDPEAAELKRRIRREVNTAYATYRLITGR